MKKFFSAIIVFFLLMVNTVVFADNNPSVSISIKGNIEAGQSIQILINVSDVKNLYAGAAKFKYDKNILKVTSFEKGDLISKSGVNVFDVGNKIDNDNGIAEFGGFSCLGKVPGFSGSGTFLIIDAQVLKKDNFHVKSVPLLSDPNDDTNLKIQLVDDNAKDMNYNFTGYDFKINSDGTAIVSQPKSESGNITLVNPADSVSSGTKNNSESISGTIQNNAQGKSGNSGSNTGGNNAPSSNENSNKAGDKQSNNDLNNSTANGNNSQNTSSKTESGTNSSGKSQASSSTNNSKTNDSKNVSSAKKNNIYIIVGICILAVLGIGFAVFKFIFKKNIGKK